MSSNRFTGPDASHGLHTAFVVAVFWAVAGGVAAGLTWRSTNSDARVLVGLAALAGALTLIAGLVVGSRTRDVRYSATGLIVSGLVTPTTFAYALNLVPVLTGIWLLVRARRNRRAPTNEPA